MTGAAARLAGLVARDLQLGFEPLRGFFERDLEPVLKIVAAARARAARSPASKESLEEVLDDRAEADVGAAARTRDGAEAVVLRALARIGEDGVCLADLLEALLGSGVAGILVGVVLAGEGAVGPLQLGVIGVPADAENLVVVLGRHARASRGARPR